MCTQSVKTAASSPLPQRAAKRMRRQSAPLCEPLQKVTTYQKTGAQKTGAQKSWPSWRLPKERPSILTATTQNGPPKKHSFLAKAGRASVFVSPGKSTVAKVVHKAGPHFVPRRLSLNPHVLSESVSGYTEGGKPVTTQKRVMDCFDLFTQIIDDPYNPIYSFRNGATIIDVMLFDLMNGLAIQEKSYGQIIRDIKSENCGLDPNSGLFCFFDIDPCPIGSKRSGTPEQNSFTPIYSHPDVIDQTKRDDLLAHPHQDQYELGSTIMILIASICKAPYLLKQFEDVPIERLRDPRYNKEYVSDRQKRFSVFNCLSRSLYPPIIHPEIKIVLLHLLKGTHYSTLLLKSPWGKRVHKELQSDPNIRRRLSSIASTFM